MVMSGEYFGWLRGRWFCELSGDLDVAAGDRDMTGAAAWGVRRKWRAGMGIGWSRRDEG